MESKLLHHKTSKGSRVCHIQDLDRREHVGNEVRAVCHLPVYRLRVLFPSTLSRKLIAMRNKLFSLHPLTLALAGALVFSACGDDDTNPMDGGMDTSMMDGGADGGDGGMSGLFTPPVETICNDSLPTPAEGLCDGAAGDGVLITATILRPGEILRGGQVLVGSSGDIMCVGCDCTSQAPSGVGTLVCPEAVVSPGLINAHDHVTFSNNQPYPTNGGLTEERYEHRHDWRRGRDGHTAIRARGQARTESMQWLELRQVMSGTTSINGSGGPEGLLRNLDNRNRNGLSLEPVDYSTFSLGDSGGMKIDSGCGYDYRDGAREAMGPNAYAPHVSEGIDAAARNEFLCLREGERDIVTQNSAFIHGVGLLAADIAEMAVDGAKLIWSPRTNVTLYGDTARVIEYAQQGVVIAMGTDWIASGSMHMGRELACADSLNQNFYGGFFPDEQLWLMATRNGAIALGVDSRIGVLAPGMAADLAIYDAREQRDHRAVLMADEGDVALVMRGGQILYGDANVVSVLGTGCDVVNVCGVEKRVCLQSEIGTSFSALQAANSEEYNLFGCNMPPNEPSCLPSRNAMGALPSPEVDGSTRYTGMSSAEDMDGDGILNENDNCPTVFNPVRPLDNGQQADHDMDGIGDSCDVCPLGGDENPAMCNAIDPNDRDNDGVPNDEDNCPAHPNPGQEDSDSDGIGDACDACPNAPNPGGSSCPATVYQVRDGSIPADTRVKVTGLLVTAIAGNGFYAQQDPASSDFNGVDFSGLFVFTGNAPTVSMGDVVDVDGAVSDFFGQAQLSSPMITTTGSATVEALTVPAADVVTGGSRAEALESILLRVENLVVDGDGTLVNTDAFITEGGLRVGGGLFAINPLPSNGEMLTFVQGPLNFGWENTRILPRALEDLGFTSLRMSPLEARVTTSGSVTFTVSLPAPAPSGGAMVTFIAAPASILTGPVSINIPQGSLTGTATFTAGATAQMGTLTASFGTDNVTAMIDVTEPFSGGLIISEYIEGSGFNKAIEVYNASSSPVDVSGCRLLAYSNNNTMPSHMLSLTGTLAPGGTFVFCNMGVTDTSACDVQNNGINHNGDDPYELICDGMLVDSVGQVGYDGDPWEANGVSTADQTLRRKCDAMPDTDSSDVYDPSVEFDAFPRDDLSGLGSHCN